jgi:MFS family permease
MGRLSWRESVAFLGFAASIGVFSAFNNFTMSLWLTGFTTSYVVISFLGNSKSLEGAIVSPVAGWLSDRTWLGVLGRRRPFILVGGLLSGLLLALTPAAARLPVPDAFVGLPAGLLRLLPLIGAIFLFTLAFNVADDLHKSLLADLTEGPHRNWLASLAVVVDIGGQVLILVLGFLLWSSEVPDWSFAFTGAIVAVGTLLTVFGLREPGPAAWEADRQREHVAAGPRPSWRSLLHLYRGAVVFVLLNFCYWSGVNAVLPLVSVYTRDILGATVGEAQLLPALLLLSTTLMAIPMGKLGTRYGKRRVMAGGYLVMAMAATAALFIATREQGAIVFFLAGVGNAATLVLRIPLLADLVPRHHMGVAAGILAASGSVAAPLASLVAGGLADVFGPRAIFAVMAVMTLAAMALLPWVRPSQALAQVDLLPAPPAQPEPTPVAPLA